MKTTTIGRIGAIVTGAAMLGTAVASAFAGAQAVPGDLDKSFFYDSNMNPIVQVVVGEKAQSIDGAAAGHIAAVIGNLAYKTVQDSKTETVEISGGTVTCPGLEGECEGGEGSAEGAVTLTWEASGLVGDLEQREMDCDIYESEMTMDSLEEGGDDGTWCDSAAGFHEDYFPEDTVSTTLVSVCQVTPGAGVSILKEDEFPNEICTICYDFCDVALGCEPHVFVEYVNISCLDIELEYDCEEESLVMTAQDGAIVYNIFTDDILTGDILDEDGALIGQSYLGRIILGQNEYYVEALDEDEITIVLGGTGSATTSVPMEYTTPTGDTYSIKLVGAQTIEDTGVVDVTLEVTKPDGTTEQVTSGVSGIPVVGDIKVKLQKGTAASNVITGEQSFAADVLVWFIPSEYTFENDEQYTEEGVQDDDGIWRVEFNGGETLTVGDVEALEDDEDLLEGIELPDDIAENDHWDDCYEDVSEDDNDTEIVRFISFILEAEGTETELLPGEMIQLPFNDGEYLLSDLKFGYQGLMDENFLPYEMLETTTLSIERDAIEVWNVTADEYQERERMVTISFVDEWGDSHNDVRLDEGPFRDGDVFIDGSGNVVRIDSVEYKDTMDDVIVEYSIKDGADWTEYEKDDDNTAGDACDFTTEVNALEFNASVDSAIVPFDINITGWSAACISGGGTWYINNATEEPDDPDDWEIWVDKDDNDYFHIAETTGDTVNTEFDDDVRFSATGGLITIDGNSEDSGADDDITVKLNWTAAAPTLIGITKDGTGCSLSGQCDDIQEGEESGTLLSLSGATIEVDSCNVVDPEEDEDDQDMICGVDITVPQNKLRPTLFFGTSSTLNESSITITDADQGAEVNIGGVPVVVESFGVTASVTAGGPVSVDETVLNCPSKSEAVSVSYETKSVNPIGYSLVVVENSGVSKTNLVLIGGPAVNGMTKGVVTVEDLQQGAKIMMSGSKLVVAGYEGADTMNAAKVLADWLNDNVQ
ncbi:MAG: S-layer protein [Candidatus Altiarchaeota archaeon]|nr:S-layer protein [Candidatus Altiarchaeota archaeon]